MKYKCKKTGEVYELKEEVLNPCIINSSLVSAQNRKRLYWTNIGMQPAGLFGDLESVIQQPKDKGLLLKDVLETNADEKYYLSDKMLNYLNTRKSNYNAGKINYKTGDDVASCINASSGHIDISDNIIVDINMPGREFVNPDKSFCLDANYYKGASLQDYLEKHRRQLVVDESTIVAMRGRNPENPKSRQSGLPTEQQVQPGECFDAEHLTSSTRRGRKMLEKSNTLMANERNFMQYTQDYRIRRLTPVECERLQTVKDGYTAHVSDSQRYKMLGNGWTIEVIAHILSYLK